MSLTTPADVVRATIPGERWSATREFCDLYPIENARAEFAGNWLANVSSSARDWCKTGGQAAIPIGGNDSLAGWNLCPTRNRTFPLSTAAPNLKQQVRAAP